jgi:glucokinase
MNSKANRLAIGIDVGGTSIRAGLVDEFGECLSTHRCATPVDVSVDALVDAIAEMASCVRLDAKPIATSTLPIGLAVPGCFDSARRTIVRSVNLPLSDGAALGVMLAQRYDGGPVTMMNDAEAATWGEYYARKDVDDSCTFVHLRLGTGIACGVVQGGSLLRLAEGRGTHWEILVVEDAPHEATCLCGVPGCLEGIASGVALIRQAEYIGIADGVIGLQRAWEQGEPAAREIIAHAAQAVRAAVGNIIEQFHPRMICLGGGVLKHLPAIECRILEGGHNDNAMASRTNLVSAKSGENAGVIGAALAVFKPGP